MAGNAPKVVLSAELDLSAWSGNVQKYMNDLARMSAATAQMASRSSADIGGVGNSMAVAIGNLAAQAISTFVQGAMRMGAEVVDTVGYFENLSVSLLYFSARLAQSKDDTLSLNDALAQSGDEAKGTLLWLEQLAILSPFNIEQVGNAFRTAQAYGLMKDQAQALLPLMIDYASVNHLNNEVLNNMALAIGQIVTNGKVMAQEIRQLANAGLPLRDILGKALNITQSQLDEMLREGVLPAGPAMKAIIDYFLQFQGAAERIARTTLPGLISSMQDLAQVSTFHFFEGISQAVIPQLGEIVDKLNGPELRATLTALGKEAGSTVAQGIARLTQTLKALFTGLGGISQQALVVGGTIAGIVTIFIAFTGALGLAAIAINALITPTTLFLAGAASLLVAMTQIDGIVNSAVKPAFEAVASVLGYTGLSFEEFSASVAEYLGDAVDTMDSFLDTVLGWGEGIVNALGQGMMGAMSGLETIVQFMGSFFSYWFAPGSPPRFLPDIDTWGADTATEYLKGWAEADFKALDDFSSQIYDGLKGLADIGEIDIRAPSEMMLGIQQMTAQAIDEIANFGYVTQETMDVAGRAAGPFSDEIKALLTSYVGYANALKQTKQAQDNLNAVQERYNTLLEPLKEMLDRAKAEKGNLDAEAEIRSLQRTINNQAVSDFRRQQAQARINEIRAQQEYDAVKASGDIETKIAQKAYDTAKKQQDEQEKIVGGVKDRIGAEIQANKYWADNVRAQEEYERIQERLAKEAREALFKPLKDALKMWELQQAELKDLIEAEKSRYIIQSDQFTVADKTKAMLELQAIAIRQATRDLEAQELGFSLDDVRKATIVFDDLGIKLKKSSGEGEDMSGVFKDLPQPDLAGEVARFNEQLSIANKNIASFRIQWNTFLDDINNSLPPFLRFRTESDKLNAAQRQYLKGTGIIEEETAPLWGNLASAFTGIVVAMTSKRLITTLVQLPTLFKSVGGWVSLLTTAVGVFAAAWQGNWFGIRDKTGPILDNLYQRFTTLRDAIAKEDIKTKLETIAGIKIDTWQKWFDPKVLSAVFDVAKLFIATQLGMTVQQFETAGSDAGRRFAQAITETFKKFWSPLYVIVAANFTRIVNGIGVVFPSVGKIFEGVLRIIAGIWENVLPILKGPFKLFLSGTGGFIKILLQPFIAAFNRLPRVIAKGLLVIPRLIAGLIEPDRLGMSLADVFGKFLGGVLTLVADLTVRISELIIGVFSRLPGALRGIFEGIKFLAPVVGTPLKAIYGFITEAVIALGDLDGTWATFVAGVKGFSPLVGTIVGGIGKFGVAVKDIGLEIVRFFISGLDTSREFIPVFTRTGEIFRGLFQAIRTGGGTFKTFVLGVFQSIGKIRLPNLSGLVDVFQNIGSAVKGGFSKGIRGLVDSIFDIGRYSKEIKISAGIRGFSNVIGGIFKGVAGGAAAGGKGILGVFSALGKFKFANIARGFGQIYGGFKNIIGVVKGFATPFNLITSALDFFVYAWNNDIDGVANGAKGFIDRVRTIWSDLISGKLWSDIVAGLTNWGGQLWSVLQTGISEGFGSLNFQMALLVFANNLRTALAAMATPIWESLRDYWWPTFVNWIVYTVENLGTTLGMILDFLGTWIATAGDWLGKEFTLKWWPAWIGWLHSDQPGIIWGKLEEWATNVWNWIVARAPVVGEKLAEWGAGMWRWITASLPETMLRLGEWTGALIKWVGDHWQTWVDTLKTWADASWQWIRDTAVPKTAEWLKSLWDEYTKEGGWGQKIGEWFSKTFPASAAAALVAYEQFSKRYKELCDEINKATGSVTGQSDTATTIFRQHATDWVKIFDLSLGYIISKFQQWVDKLLLTVKAFYQIRNADWEGLWKTMGQFAAEDVIGQAEQSAFAAQIMEEIGKTGAEELIHGYNDGMMKNEREALKQTGNFGSAVNDTFGKEIDANSPSGTFIQFALDTIKGYVQGIQDNTYLATDEVKVFAGKIKQIATDLNISLLTMTNTFFVDLKNAIGIKLDDLEIYLNTRMVTIANGVLGVFDQLNTQIVPRLTTFKDTVLTALVGNTTDSMASQLILYMGGTGEQGQGGLGFIIGDALMEGMIRGVQSGETKVVKAFIDSLKVISDAINTNTPSLPVPAVPSMPNYRPNLYTPSPAQVNPSANSMVVNTTNLNLNVSTTATSQGVVSDFTVMRTMV